MKKKIAWMEGRWNHQFWKVLITVLPWIAERNPMVSLVQDIHAGFPSGELGAIESKLGWIIWVIRKSRKQLARLIQISFAVSQVEIRWRTGCISSFFFFVWWGGRGFFFPNALLKFISISGSSFKAHCCDHSRGGQHSLYSKGRDFTLVPLWFPRSCFSFHPSKSKNLKVSFLVLSWSFIASCFHQSPEYFWKEFFD